MNDKFIYFFDVYLGGAINRESVQSRLKQIHLFLATRRRATTCWESLESCDKCSRMFTYLYCTTHHLHPVMFKEHP